MKRERLQMTPLGARIPGSALSFEPPWPLDNSSEFWPKDATSPCAVCGQPIEAKRGIQEFVPVAYSSVQTLSLIHPLCRSAFT
jgi:hypothetical protein